MPVRRKDLPLHKVSSRVVTFKVTPEEGRVLDALAVIRKLKTSEYLRALIFEDEARVRSLGKRLPKR